MTPVQERLAEIRATAKRLCDFVRPFMQDRTMHVASEFSDIEHRLASEINELTEAALREPPSDQKKGTDGDPNRIDNRDSARSLRNDDVLQPAKPSVVQCKTCWEWREYSLVIGEDRARIKAENATLREQLALSISTTMLNEAVKAAKREGFNEGIEAAAQRTESGSFFHDKSPAKLFADELAPVIRALKRAESL